MAKDDWAIVVGIQSYFDKDLPKLEGPENDAQAFYDWVIACDGGAVPPSQAQLILSSKFEPPFPSVDQAMPTAAAIKGSFDHLFAVAAENEEKGIADIGQRLYLFFAGHGFAPSHRDDLTALVTAEAGIANANLSHVLGSHMADALWRSKLFREILLFMDCCRSIMDCAQLFMPYPEERATDFHEGKRFYAYGARVGKESREWQPPGKKCHGVFTMTLLEGLRGAAADPLAPGVITAESLRDQLYNGFRQNVAPSDYDRIDMPKEPEILFEKRPGGNFTIANVPRRIVDRVLGGKQKYKVVVESPADLVGKPFRIVNGAFKQIVEEQLQPKSELSLERGLYAIEVPGTGIERCFEVTGSGQEATLVRL